MKFPQFYEPPGLQPFTPLPAQDPVRAEQGPMAVVVSMEINLQTVKNLLHAPTNKDLVTRYIQVGGRKSVVIYIDGMIDRGMLSDFILRPLQHDASLQQVPDSALLTTLMETSIAYSAVRQCDDILLCVEACLNGEALLFIDGCTPALLMDVRGYEKRGVDTPKSETVILGPQEAFTENLRTSITLVRRMVRAEQLVTEYFDVGDTASTKVALLYMRDIANPELVNEARKRITSTAYDFVPGAGYLQQLIEDKPNALVPQLCMTERPDRTAFFLMEGHIAVLSDSSPYALCAPSTFWHLMHATDDSFMRWQTGSFLRLIRYGGMFLSLFLPALYLAVIMFHSELLPIELLSSITLANAMVPLPMVLEVLVMELAFDLVHEAGTRVPGALGPALGIIGALILGQAAVAANIVSPILIIIVAVTGLGNFAMPNYCLSISMRLIRLFLILASMMFGLLGTAVVTFLVLVMAARLTSFGVPWLAPMSPRSTSNKDIFIRGPITKQHIRPSILKARMQYNSSGGTRVWDTPEKKS